MNYISKKLIAAVEKVLYGTFLANKCKKYDKIRKSPFATPNKIMGQVRAIISTDAKTIR